eukprot:TRINITY_DN92249_c0_g1_i1.p1 TRINITY_DN92249_c0_g1~~TRINITY_DN92249_c0_g1_i1.p1  ORF type:complete len:602 (-),score=84.21 TRINITY_DN92249_c0_g1_i1:93-1898(-)
MALTMPQTLEPHIDPAAPPGGEGYDKLRRRHGEMKLPMHAILSRERAAPDAPLYLRERDPGQAFVEVDFQLGEHPLGLVVDWSMALPVVSGVVPGSFAATHLRLVPGIVLLAANKIPVVLGAGREEVEESLAVRPLSLLFEAPDDMVFSEKLPVAWLQSALVAQNALSAGRTGLVDPAAASQLMRARAEQLSSMRGTSVPRGGTQAASVLANALTDQHRVAKDQAGYQDFFQLHPERSPLSRFGSLNAVNPNPLAGTFRDSHGLSKMQGSASLPALGFDSSSMQGANSTTLPSIPGPLGMSKTFSSGFSTSMRGARTGNKKSAHNKSLTWLAAGAPRPDRAYEHLLETETPTYGPGPPALWPLGHEEEYLCRLGDFSLCSRLREAYEVGFRGKKRDPPTDIEKLLGGVGDAMRIRRVAKVETINCDNCGIHLSDAEKPGQGKFFYYCRRCKRNGRRFELCLNCHALEVLQAEGKYSSRGVHPHFLRCEHRSLVRKQNLEAAYPNSPHLRRVFCDLCGHTIVGRGAADKRTDQLDTGASRKSSQAAANATANPRGKAYITSNEFFICHRCPEETGLRFELCEQCYGTLQAHGRGVARLEMVM